MLLSLLPAAKIMKKNWDDKSIVSTMIWMKEFGVDDDDGDNCVEDDDVDGKMMMASASVWVKVW